MAVFALACAPDDASVTRRLELFSLAGCPVPRDAETFEVTAVGDFPPSNATTEVLGTSDAGRELVFTDELRAATARSRDAGEPFTGFGERDAGGVRLTLWPEGAPCRLTEPQDSSYPGRGGGQAFGVSSATGQVLIASGSDARSSDALVGVLTFSTRDGAIARVTRPGDSLREPRAYASVTEFGGAFLIAGGEDPLNDVPEEQRLLRDTAEVFDPEAGRITGAPIALAAERTRHAAARLPNGDTLLVGGRGHFGDALTLVEAVSVSERRARIAGLEQLSVGRIEPSVVRLSDGKLLVAGGRTGGGKPVQLLEWLTADATQHAGVELTDVVPARFDRAFVALPGGGALAVGGCVEAPVEEREAKDCGACRFGCPPQEGYDAYWIAADGSATPLADFGIEAPRPLLVEASDGAPWLFAGGDAGSGVTTGVAYRFNAFRARFERQDVSLGVPPSPDFPPPRAVDPGLFVWLGAGEGEPASLFGLRTDARSRYVNDLGLIAARRADDPESPRHLVADRPPLGALEYDSSLEWVAEGPKVLLADADFADVRVTLTVTGALPEVWLGDAPYGRGACAWPEGTASTLSCTRAGDEVTLSRGERRISCAGPRGRVTVGIGGRATTRVLTWEVARLR